MTWEMPSFGTKLAGIRGGTASRGNASGGSCGVGKALPNNAWSIRVGAPGPQQISPSVPGVATWIDPPWTTKRVSTGAGPALGRSWASPAEAVAGSTVRRSPDGVGWLRTQDHRVGTGIVSVRLPAT